MSWYEICTAQNGYDAINRVKEQSPDLVLLDIIDAGDGRAARVPTHKGGG